MPIPHTRMTQVFARRIEAFDKHRAESFAVGALASAVVAAPSPQKTKTSTGRARASMRIWSRFAGRFDPGPLGSFKIPRKANALFGLTGRRFGDKVFFTQGVPYGSFVDKRWAYRTAQAAHNGGRARIEKDTPKMLKKVGKTK